MYIKIKLKLQFIAKLWTQDYVCNTTVQSPTNVKNGIANTLLRRAETHSSNDTEYREELKKIDEVLQTNKYPNSYWTQ
jgi:hypothetical protein